ncbi:uncharacterized methyltransferase YdaC-like [Protopterus annectens]|uniref:uncharacterized methyltransferase YdaC-like n=1 Tax=Protopterus annectens TaxID=7888 RepID=UPI001CFC40A0|nr:uncharacterized methyltransferase YdaC-like [Protopterus annectens]
MLKAILGEQLGKPTKTIAGWLVSLFFKTRNVVLEENAVRLCNIQPDDTVLEVGFGPGVGLSEAAKYLTGPKGKLYGIDYSEYMYKMASRNLHSLLEAGRLCLFHGSVERIPLSDSTVDKVYHCNCYYFWPDLRTGSREIHRVMKPGAVMVSTLYLESIMSCASKGILNSKKWEPEPYMAALRDTGFIDVRMETRQHKGKEFQAIFATAIK